MLAQVRKPKLLRVFAAARLVVTIACLLFCYDTFASYCNERSLPYDNLTCKVIVEMFFFWYGNVCLLSIDNIDNLIIDVHDGTFTNAYMCDIANDNDVLVHIRIELIG